MKKLFTLLTMLMFSVATFAKVPAISYKNSADTTHLTKNGKKDMRYKDNRAAGPVTRSGKKDMRYKANNPNAGAKKKTP